MKFPPLRRAVARRSTPHVPNPTIVLAIILACYLMIVLDVSVIITAIPRIRTVLDFSAADLSWVQNAYTLTFGGLLLLGARAGDLLGRRRVFVAGIALFTLASLLAGLAQSAGWLLAARAVQGVGAAIAAPSTLALLMTTFREGGERTRALGLYSAVAGGGGSVGLVVGGMLTDWVSWRWGMFLNVPIGLALIALAPRHLPETVRSRGRFDLAGAATSTLAMTALVYGFVRAAEAGWGERWTVASFVAGVLLLGAFVVNERRAEQPITPLRLFASRERSGAYVARILVVGGIYSMFFFLTQYLQWVLHFSPLQAGMAFLPQTIVLFATTRIVPRVVRRADAAHLLIGGVAVALAGMLWLGGNLSAGASFLTAIAPSLVLIGAGMGVALTPLTAAGVAGVAERDAGAASGLVNVAHQAGATLGVAVLVTAFSSAAGDGSSTSAIADGVSTALAGSSALLLAGLLAIVLVMRTPLPAVGRAWAWATTR